ncbi:MAG: RNA polymerase subunit sigma-24 [Kordia sp.]|nr:MAG: RNA polymerase subunit sigma-24 [Kordia sp.]
MKKSNNISDAKLVLAYQSGNKKAIAILVEQWHEKFCKQAYWYTKDKDAAKDIAQDSWNIIIHKLNNLNDPEKFGYWALTIVCRKAIDWTREKSKTLEQQKDYHQVLNSFSEESNISEDSKKVLLAIKKLPDIQQTVLRLFYIESYSLKQISSMLGLSKGTVKSRLFYAREKLKKQSIPSLKAHET